MRKDYAVYAPIDGLYGTYDCIGRYPTKAEALEAIEALCERENRPRRYYRYRAVPYNADAPVLHVPTNWQI